MADGDKEAVAGHVANRSRAHVPQPNAGDRGRIAAAQHLRDLMVPDHLDRRVGEQPLLQDLLGPQFVATVHERDFGGELGQEQSFLDRRIPAADHHDFLAAVEKAIAGGAGRNARALQCSFALQAEPFGLSSGGDDQGLGQPHRPGIAGQPEGPGRKVGGYDDVIHDFGADVRSLFPHLVHQPRALDDLREAGIVLDVGGDGELAARRQSGEQGRAQQSAGGVDRGSVTGGSRSHDQTADGARFGRVRGHGRARP